MKKCDCAHLGHCTFQTQPLRMTYLNHDPIYRGLAEDEQARSLVATPIQRDLNPIEAGDFLATDARGNMSILARALEPERAVAYAESKIGRRCKADSFMWRKSHPYPPEL